MPDLSTTYMGLGLANPFIVSSSSLTSDLDRLKSAEDAGAGAVVLKSLFEEQIIADAKRLDDHGMDCFFPEISDFVRGNTNWSGPDAYLQLIREAKSALSIPVIGSVNCVFPGWWASYAAEMEKAGADAVELNISPVPGDIEKSATEIENGIIEIVRSVRQKTSLPIAVKLGNNHSSMFQLAGLLSDMGANALVLFNRFYRFDIDLEKLELTHGPKFSHPDEISEGLRWTALLSGRTELDLAATTGIHDEAAAIKMILAGARAVQVCSILYLNGMQHIGRMITGMNSWMEKHGFSSLDDFRGRLSQQASDEPEKYQRLQFVRMLVGID